MARSVDTFPDGMSESDAKTLGGRAHEPPRPITSVSPPSGGAGAAFGDRYGLHGLLGQGGMGEVFVATDQRIGRDVALKVARAEIVEQVLGRFARECRLQGQLEHPGVVPVYDVGNMPDGAPFFTMKRVRGDTLENVRERLAAGDVETRSRYTRPRLLALFITVCQTMHYAHSRGVVHRDLKPQNVMVGDFGEVYVLDWGIAKLTGVTDDAPREAAQMREVEATSDSGARATRQGELLGTLGYMSPEQIRDASAVGPRADVYSLGVMLFEMLAHVNLHVGDTRIDVLETTLAGTEHRIRSVANDLDLPPELTEACVRSTALDPTERHASADDLRDAVQRYLDGDRDLEARSKLAEKEARQALAVIDATPANGLSNDREEALQHAGRALALDPTNPLAQAVVMRLIVDGRSGGEPPDVTDALERASLRVYRRGGLLGAALFAVWMPFVLTLLVGNRSSGRPLLVWGGSLVIAVVLLLLNARARARTMGLYFATLVACLASTTVAARVAGPFISVPGMVTLTVVMFLLLARRSWQLGTVVLGAVALVLPALAEHLGWVEATTRFDEEGMHVLSNAVRVSPPQAAAALIVTTGVIYAVLCLAARHLHGILVANARRNAVQQWRLALLVPREARSIASAAEAPAETAPASAA